ncbi:PDDEXK nuclease domain-containing protein [Myxococcota bacterium]|nr:PDDEXK nuclease domain-containing protein [Myxococcota bacterium]
MSTPLLPADASSYAALLDSLKRRVHDARRRAIAAANQELMTLYFEVGQSIVARQAEEGWGAKVIDRLARDLQAAFPDMDGFSPRNLHRMRAFYLAWGEVEPGEEKKLPQAVAKLPWGHNTLLLEKLRTPSQRLFYAERSLQHGWSRAILSLQIAGQLHRREGMAVTNFPALLPPPDSDLALQATRDPYLFDFLTLHASANERDIERALMQHIERFLLELGAGFAFIGRQVAVDIGGEDHKIDLLFYHLRLRNYVVIELKARPFDGRDVGQLNMYLSAVDDQLRQPTDGPTIGLLLCRGKNRVKAEYALRGLMRPIGVADWETQLVESLPEELAGNLPSVAELERELSFATLNDEPPDAP